MVMTERFLCMFLYQYMLFWPPPNLARKLAGWEGMNCVDESAKQGLSNCVDESGKQSLSLSLFLVHFSDFYCLPYLWGNTGCPECSRGCFVNWFTFNVNDLLWGPIGWHLYSQCERRWKPSLHFGIAAHSYQILSAWRANFCTII